VRIEIDDLEKGSVNVPKDITVEQINVKAGGAELDVRDMAIMQDEIRFTVGGDLGKNTRLELEIDTKDILFKVPVVFERR